MDMKLSAPGRVKNLTQLNATRHQCARPQQMKKRRTNRMTWPLVGELSLGAVVNLPGGCRVHWACVINTLATVYSMD